MPRIIPACVIAGVVIVGDCETFGDAAGGFHRLRQPEVEHLHRAVWSRTLMLAGFRSRWMMPCSCAASSASAICFAIGSASSSGIASARNALRQILALDQFHHEGVHAVGVFQPVDARRCWDDSVRRGLPLRAESAPADRGRLRETVGQDLDGDLALQLRVRRPIHLAHPTLADLRGDFVDAEAGAGREGQAIFVDYTGGTAGRTGLLLPDAAVLTNGCAAGRSPLGDYSGLMGRTRRTVTAGLVGVMTTG